MRHVDPVSEHAGRESALRRAARSAFWNGALPSTFRSLVVKTEVETCGYRRVAHRIEERVIVLQLAPAHGSRAGQVEPVPSPRGMDPWAPDPARLPSQSEKICVCPRCAGEKKVECPECNGTTRVRCPECNGSGRVRGQRGMKNCPSCRARTTVQCKACSKGKVECPACAGIGRVRAWLEVESAIRVQIKVHPPGSITALHRGLHEVGDLDRDPGSYRIPCVDDSGWVDKLSESLPGELQATLDPVAERIIRQRGQAFQSDVFHMTYATRTSAGVVDVSGDPPGILPGSNWWPLRRRLLWAMFVGFAMFVAAALFYGAYVGRAAWFHEHGNGGPIAVLGLLAAIVTSSLMAHAWLPQPARRSSRIKVKAAVIGAAWLAMAILWFTGNPSIDGIQASLTRGDVLAARLEADAIHAIHASPSGIDDTLRLLAQREEEAEQARRHADDEQHLQQVTTAPTLASAVESLGARWWSEGFAGQARAAVIARAGAEIEQHFQASNAAGLIEAAALLHTIDAGTATRARALSTLARASDCLTRQDFACAIAALDAWNQQPLGDPPAVAAHETIRERTRAELHQWLVRASFKQTDLAERKLALERAIANAQLHDGAFGKPPVPVQSLRAQLAKTEQQIESERRRAALLEQRRKAAEEREARRQAAAERRQQRWSAPLLCNDGTYSPSCTCDGSWRGCCSHHGGVAGCSE